MHDINQEFEDFETGTVVGIEGKTAIVELSMQPACETCGARMVCTPDQNGKKSMKVINTIGAGIGSKVTIGESANFLLKMSALQYGLPFLGFMAGILMLYAADIRLANLPQELLFFIGGLIGLGGSAMISHKISKRMAGGDESFFRITNII